MDIKKKTFYFIGIGGIGMSSLVNYLLLQGHRIYGYDKVSSTITDQLTQKGAEIIFDAQLSAVPENALSSNVTVVYTAAISEDHPQLIYFKSQGNQVMKRAVFLGELCKHSTTLAVAGTHGKTTTSSILTHIFYQTNQSFSAFLGGMINTYDTNFISTGTKYTIVEADEFDRSFMALYPDVASITSMDADHLDIYHSKENLTAAFHSFSKQVSGSLITAFGLPIKGWTYGNESQDADYKVSNVHLSQEGYLFDLITPNKTFKGINFKGVGDHNLQNALCAVAMADQVGIPLDDVLKCLATFPGVQRRMNIYKLKRHILIDDYAHHPTEIHAVWETMNRFYPNRSKTVVFQPHLFSRTQDFMDDFAHVLSQFDEVILLDIYPAREEPIDGVDSIALLHKVKNKDKKLIQKEQLSRQMEMSNNSAVFALLGAGDIGLEVKTILNHFNTV